MKFFKSCAVLLCVALAATLCGCWNYIDIESEFVVMGVTVDKDKQTGEFRINAEIAKSTGGKDAKLVTRVESSTGITVFDAMRNIISKIGSKLYWGHTMVYIISESIANDGILDALNMISSQTQMRSDMFIMICEDDSIDKVFQFQDPIHETVSQHLHDLFESYEALGKFRRCPMFKVLQELASEEVCLMLPYIKVVREHDPTKQSEDPGEIPIVEGSVVFRGDKKAGLLDGTQTRSALMMKGENIKEYSLAIPAQGDIPSCSIEDISTDVNITPVLDDEGRLRFRIDMQLEADVVEIQTSENLISDKTKGGIESAFQNMLLGQLSDAILMAQSDGADVFGFAGVTHRKLPAYYKNVSPDWISVFSSAFVDISVTFNITNSSLSFKPIKAGL